MVVSTRPKNKRPPPKRYNTRPRPPPKAAAEAAAPSTRSKQALQTAPAKPSKPRRLGKRELWDSSSGTIIKVQTATLPRLKQPKLLKLPNTLWLIPSAVERQERLQALQHEWQQLELQCLPPYGGRSWKVTVELQDTPNALFVWKENNLQLACHSHWRQQLPAPLDYPLDLEDPPLPVSQEDWWTRVVKTHQHTYPLPKRTIVWCSPNGQRFTARKPAWDCALQLTRHEVWLEKHLHGYSCRTGKLLKPTHVSKPTALQIGLVRFQRDGLWVVGQEQAWQHQRPQDEPQQQQQQQQSTLKSPLAFYLQQQRHSHRRQLQQQQQQQQDTSVTLKQAEADLRRIWKTLLQEQRDDWKRKWQQHTTTSATLVGSACRNVQVIPDPRLSEKPAARVQPDESHTTFPTNDKSTEPSTTNDKPTETVATMDEAVLVDHKTLQTDDKPSETLSVAKMQEAESHNKTVPANDKSTETSTMATMDEAVLVDHKTLQTDDRPSEPLSVAKMQETKSAESHNKTLQTNDTPCEKPTAAASIPVSPTLDKNKPKRSFTPSTHWRLNPEQIQLCYDACLNHFEQVMCTVKARDLHRELADGFDLLRERGRGRYDMELPAFDTPVFGFLNNNKAPWMPIVRKILGDDAVLIHKGCFLSMPGSHVQDYHQDGLHLTTQRQKPCHAINVFVPLVDMSLDLGPTEFVVGSHILGYEEYNKDFLETPTPKAGTPVIFDYRLGHRGLANTSSVCRPIVYCTYAAAAAQGRPEFRDVVNFSRKRYRKLGPLLEKPLSRDERIQKRKRSLDNTLKQKQSRHDTKKDHVPNQDDSSVQEKTDLATKRDDSVTTDHAMERNDSVQEKTDHATKRNDSVQEKTDHAMERNDSVQEKTDHSMERNGTAQEKKSKQDDGDETTYCEA